MTALSAIRSSFSSRLIMFNFSSILIAFRRFFAWIALDDVELCFSVPLVRKDKPVEEETK
jgi:hypothetical protein